MAVTKYKFYDYKIVLLLRLTIIVIGVLVVWRVVESNSYTRDCIQLLNLTAGNWIITDSAGANIDIENIVRSPPSMSDLYCDSSPLDTVHAIYSPGTFGNIEGVYSTGIPISRLDNLEIVSLVGVGITNDDCVQIASGKSIQYLFLDSKNVSEEELLVLSKSKSIRSIVIYGNDNLSSNVYEQIYATNPELLIQYHKR